MSPLRALLSTICCLLAVAVFAGESRAQGHDRVLRVAWSLQAPYQFLRSDSEIAHVTGIDVTTFRAAAEHAGLSVVLDQVPWEQALKGVEEGSIDAVLAAYPTPERATYAHFSDPIRFATENIFLPANRMPTANTLPELLDGLISEQLRIAVVEDYDLGATFNRFRDDPAHADVIVQTVDLAQSLHLLETGEVDGFVMDRLAGYHELSERHLWGLESHPLPILEEDVVALFSRASVAPGLVERFNWGLERVYESGERQVIERRFVLPVLLDIALYGAWFEIILIIGMVSFSISAVVIARAGDYGIFGAVVLASLPALGGGVVRDLLILREPYIFDEPVYVYIVLATLAAGFLINRVLDRLRGRSLLLFDLVNLLLIIRQRAKPQILLELFDTAGIAALTVLAVTIAVEFGRHPLWLWGPVLAALTAAGGAIIRDMIRNDSGNAILHHAFYAETVILWSLGLSLYLQYFGLSAEPHVIFWALMTTMGGILATRIAFVVFGWSGPRY